MPTVTRSDFLKCAALGAAALGLAAAAGTALAEDAPEGLAPFAFEPVSYTHLDVYKRQISFHSGVPVPFSLVRTMGAVRRCGS